jgi:CRP/FNR family transcriptional regulator, cyclic AMP receptor protein
MNTPPPTDAATAPMGSARSLYYDAAVAKRFFENCGQAEKFAAGTTLFVENETSSHKNIFTKPINANLFSKSIIHRMYFLTEGTVELTAVGKLIDTVGPGEIFGEMAVVSEIPGFTTSHSRSATAVARTDCIGYSLDGSETELGLERTPEFALMLMSLMFERLRLLDARLATREVAKARSSNRAEPVFDAATLKAIAGRVESATVVRFAEGRQIMKQGHPGSTMYIVLEGHIAISVGNKIVEKLAPGGVFGEMALVDHSPRTASADARTDCVLLSMNRAALIALVKLDPSIGMAMLRCVADRIRYMNSLFA